MDSSKQLEVWYGSLNPLKVDLVGDFAGKELFAIHGEALMLHCIAQARVDFCNGFQILHAVHAVESFLCKLRDRGCNFHVVWFDEHIQISSPSPRDELSSKYSLTRAILIRHLQQAHIDTAPQPIHEFCFEFPGLAHNLFKKYLAQNCIHFFLCLDPKAFAGCCEDLAQSYLGIAHWLGVKGYSLAFINCIKFVSSQVRCSVVSPSSSWKQTDLVLPERIKATEGRSHSFSVSLLSDAATEDWTPWENGKKLTSREATALYVLCKMATSHSKEPQAFCDWAATYVIHLALLRRLPLAFRSLGDVALEDEEIMQSFLSEFSTVCADMIPHISSNFQWDSFDILDGRLLRFVTAKQVHLSKDLALEVHNFANELYRITGINIEESLLPICLAQLSTGDPTQPGDDPPSPPGYSVLPFSQTTLHSYLHEVYVMPPITVREKQSLPKIFKELSHWHNARVRVDVKQPTIRKTKWEARSNQIWLNTFMKYSASLTNASGKMINPETIVVGEAQRGRMSNGTATQAKPAGFDTKSTKHSKAAKSDDAKLENFTTRSRKKPKEMSGKEKALKAAEAIRKGKAELQSNTMLSSWEDQCKRLEAEPDLIARYRETMRYLSGLKGQARVAVGPDVSVYSCNVLASMLKAGHSRSSPEGNSRVSALLWSTIVDLSKQDISAPSGKLFNALASALGFQAATMRHIPGPVARPLPYLSLLDRDAKLPNLPAASIDFQLQHCGPFLERSFDPAPDPRVPFQPDAWQRKVLDAIDADKSLFVVAPTSAGKTFISFYAMKKVLKASDDGILVYVAPTKALVNQIAAEIQARYSKSYKQNGSVWAIHTRDYRINDPSHCQILVTVPHMLQIMLMAPSNADQPNSWSRRVRRIIFDEVHCIGQADDGVIWEQLLLLAPCPIIALSATVGNPEEFRDWLEGSERAKGYELEMIVHSTRYSDLRKFLWKPRTEFVFNGLKSVDRLPIPGLNDGSETAAQFFYIHPVASIVNRNRGTIQDLSLEPRDCATLWASMARHQNGIFPLDSSLDPAKAFRREVGTPGRVVRKADVAEYEIKLKDCLQTWMTDRRSPFEAVQNDLRSPCEAPEFSTQDLQTQALTLLTDLHAQGALPAILFNYDRVNCEDIAFRLLSDLLQAEQAWKASEAEWKRRMAKFEKWKRDKCKIQALNEKKAKAKAKGKRQSDGEDDEEVRMEDDPSAWASFDPQAPLSAFSFADHTKLPASELEETICSLRFRDINSRIIDALRRGIGVHHAGMNHKYRQVVEMLFRKGFLTVVIATGTLALGINMPCKTVVFYGDSVFLTALNYHQAAGRAGRRGFDLLGNVVFAGMTQERVYEIMSSRLPDLRGHFPLSTTLVLRTLGLLHHTKNCDYSVRAVKSLLSQTRLYLGGPTDQMTIRHHLRFSIEYLRRQHLLDEAGAPLNFAGLVGHLYFTENAVFAFHSLLKEGYFHTLCAEYSTSSVATLRKIVLVLCHIFCRIPTRDVTDAWREVIQKSPSLVLLPSLPEEALGILRQHNQDTLDIFKSYTSTFIDQHLHDKPDRSLPFTKLDVGACNDGNGSLDERCVQKILGSNKRGAVKLRSPFAALSGFDDYSFSSIHELCTTIRSGVFLEESAVPYIPLHPDDTDGRPWNAYIYDFYKHGDMEALVRDNRIKRGDVWFYLKNFSLVLATIVTSLQNFMNLAAGNDADLAMVDVQDARGVYQGGIDDSDYADDDNDDGGGGGGGRLRKGEAAPGANVAGRGRKAEKAVVPDSWDDGSEDGSLGDSASTGDRDPAADGPASSRPPAWQGDGEHKLPQVLALFETVRSEFDDKFRGIWA